MQDHSMTALGAMVFSLSMQESQFQWLGHAIKGERLLAEQMKLSLQIHGQEHDPTKSVKLVLETVKQQKVIIPSQPGVEFKVFQYEAAGDEYIVRGGFALGDWQKWGFDKRINLHCCERGYFVV